MSDAERLFQTYHAMLVRYLTRRLGDRDWAEEVAQETFVRALRQETIVNERAWLFAVATNLVRDEARKDARRRRHLALLAEQERDSAAEPETTTLERAQEAAMARKAAEALGLSPGSVGTTLSRARRRLVEAYEALQKGMDERERGGHAAH